VYFNKSYYNYSLICRSLNEFAPMRILKSDLMEVFPHFFVVFVVPRLELMASHLLGRHSAT
jgi:hypothetical protein